MTYVQKGTFTYRIINLALFAAGFTTFTVLYGVQPLLPEFAREFHISPAAASLALSLSTFSLAVSMLLVGSLSEAWGRKPVMTFSLFAASVLTVLSAFTHNFHLLLVVRVLLGIILAGLPAIAMAYLGEEIEPASLGVAMGLYISGNSVGGMSGRIISAMLTDFFNWHVALDVIGVLGVLAGFLFWLMLPSSKNFKARPLETKKLVNSMVSHLKDPGLICLFSIGFLLMGSFVTLYNYVGFQLIAPPYNLSQTLVGWIFISYIMGTVSSAWMGKLADKHGHRKVILAGISVMFAGACLTLDSNLWLKIAGIAVFTFGFFGSHSIASSWVGKRATHSKAQASSLYLFFYYVGSSVGGTSGGFFWSSFGWGGVVGMIACFLILAMLLSVRLSSIPALTRPKVNLNS